VHASRCLRHFASTIGNVRLRSRCRLEWIEIGFGRETNFELDLLLEPVDPTYDNFDPARRTSSFSTWAVIYRFLL
jgi:hypothetical protein